MARMTREQRSKALEELSARVKARIEEMADEELADYGEMFEGRYSPKNVVLILTQRPDATVVRGYDQWKSEGRQVRKGEHGIKIRKVVSGPDRTNAAGEVTAQGWRSMIWLTVFDIDQTDPITADADLVTSAA